MKTVYANGTIESFIGSAQNWVSANPAETFFIMTVSIMMFCFKLKDLF